MRVLAFALAEAAGHRVPHHEERNVMDQGDPRPKHDASIGQLEPNGRFSWMCLDCDAAGSGLTRDEAIAAAAEHARLAA